VLIDFFRHLNREQTQRGMAAAKPKITTAQKRENM
jgi:hypothetical protein